ncbi:MAG: hypothetical protein V5A42_00710 [Halofilum sp. (in: g-proteobacteria)]
MCAVQIQREDVGVLELAVLHLAEQLGLTDPVVEPPVGLAQGRAVQHALDLRLQGLAVVRREVVVVLVADLLFDLARGIVVEVMDPDVDRLRRFVPGVGDIEAAEAGRTLQLVRAPVLLVQEGTPDHDYTTPLPIDATAHSRRAGRSWWGSFLHDELIPVLHLQRETADMPRFLVVER